MSGAMLAEEIKNLPDSYISQISDFIMYLKLKSKFNDFESHKDSYKEAISRWRNDSKELFADDAQFMNSAFELNRSQEMYKPKEIW
ncbi:MAG: hypothetical protein K6B17_01175 [Treponema sp.]|nr:hypothetical protein [Treponema sp.]